MTATPTTGASVTDNSDRTDRTDRTDTWAIELRSLSKSFGHVGRAQGHRSVRGSG